MTRSLTKWSLLAVLVTAVIATLALNGLVKANQAQATGPQVVGTADLSPVMRYPARTIALTFEDGPNPATTPEILEVLRRYGVPATFFVSWGDASEYPALLREIRAQGSEIGLQAMPGRDLTLDQLALAGATGEISNLARPVPAAGTTGADIDQAARRLTAKGFVTATANFDSGDRHATTADAIVTASTPMSSSGGALLLHEDGAETVAALNRLIPQLRAQGWTFTTVSAAVGLPEANTPAATSDRIAGTVLLAAVGWSTAALDVLQWILLAVGLLMLARTAAYLVIAGRHARRVRRTNGGGDAAFAYTLPVTVVVPAYNEKECIEATLRSLLASDHPIEIVVVDDGSTDGTSEIVEALALPGVRLIRQSNGGKPSALNTGIRAASHEIVVLLDGDTVFESTTVSRLVRAFSNPEVGAVAGNAKVVNRNRLVTRWQHIEYVMGFNLDRRVQDTWRCMATIPGAVGAYRRAALFDVGGVSDDTLAEDTDLTIALIRTGWRIVYEESARAWTEAPATMHQLWLQRYRWSYGTMQAMWKHRRTLIETGPSGHFGRTGLLNLAVFGIALPLLAPVADIFLLYCLIVDPMRALMILAGVQVVQLVSAAFAFRLDGEKLGVLWVLPLQQFLYRQMMYAVLIRSITTAITGGRLRWHKLRRVGDFGALGADAMSSAPAARLVTAGRHRAED